MASDRPSANFDGLTVLRGVFAWWVTLYHVRHWLLGTPAQDLERILSFGYLGVDFFFVLSGFLITYLILKEKEQTGKINVKDFYIRRFLRIWPLYFAVIVFSLIIIPLIQKYLNITNILDIRPIYYLTFLK